MKTDEEMSSREYAAFPFIKSAIEELDHAEKILFHGGFKDRDKAVRIAKATSEIREVFELTD